MAYCCKCGVALDEHVAVCPLCHFEIPDDLIEKKNKELPYPKAINAHVDNSGVVKNKILYAYAMISFAIVLILLVLNSIITPTHQYFQYAIVGIVASILYLFLFLGYIKRLTYILMCLGLLTWLMCVFLDSLDNQLVWSITWALPIIGAMTFIFVIVRILYVKGKHTNHFIFIPVYICTGLAILIPLIELTIRFNIGLPFKLTWSLIATISLVAFSTVVAGLYYQTPEYIKERLIRIFHI
jgi:hypothetical protein